MNREDILASLHNSPDVPVLIIGGGINGIGVFCDLALNGVNVILVERSDFCSGASAASSHMAHGGLRYLENGEFRLVREAVRERNLMIRNAPHLVKPLPTTIPIFKLFSGLLNAPLKFLRLLDRPGERGSLVIKMGLLLYDAFTGRQPVVPRHRFLSRSASLKRWPELHPTIVNTATYYDGAILNPERLALELILDAEAEGNIRRQGSSHSLVSALNYVSLVEGTKDTVQLRDELTDRTFHVRPKLVINATGAWIDFSSRMLGLATHYIGGTKGSHLVLNHPQLRAAIGEHEFFFENKDGRIVLIFPLFDRVLIGTSDIRIDNPSEAVCTDEEIEYFLAMIARIFPRIKVGREHIVFQFAGVRPLAYSSTMQVSQITRDHIIQVASGEWTGRDYPIYSLVGGKWTSFRVFSEQVTNKALNLLGLERQKQTHSLPIGGGRGFAESSDERKRQIEAIAAWTGLSHERVLVLYDRYGTRAQDLADYLVQGPDGPLNSLPEFSRREIGFLGLYEKVVHLDDLILRRTMIAMLGRLTRNGLQELSQVLGNTLGWDIARKKAEEARTVSRLKNKHGVSL